MSDNVKRIGKNCKYRIKDESRWWVKRDVFICSFGQSPHYKCGANAKCWNGTSSYEGGHFSPQEAADETG